MTGAWLSQKKLHHFSETRPTAAIVGMVWSSKSRNIRNGHRQLSDHDGHINPYVVGLIFRLIFPSTLGHLQLYNSVESTGTFVGIDRKKTLVSNKPTNPTDHTPPLFFLLLLTSVARTISTRYSTSVEATKLNAMGGRFICEPVWRKIYDFCRLSYHELCHMSRYSFRYTILPNCTVELLQNSESLRDEKCDTRLKN